MASERNSDENLNPEDKTIIPAKLVRRISAAEKKQRQRFERSGMKEGAIFKYLRAKKAQEESNLPSTDSSQPVPAPSSSREAMTNVNRNTAVTASTSHNNNSSVEVEPINTLGNNQEDEDACAGLVSSQDSSVIFDGEYDRNANKHVETVELSDEEDGNNNINNNREQHTNGNNRRCRENDNQCVQEVAVVDEEPVDEISSNPSPENRQDYSLSDNNVSPYSNVEQNNFSPGDDTTSRVNLPLEEPLTAADKIERWQRCNKRAYQEEEVTSGVSRQRQDTFQPSSSKLTRRERITEALGRSEKTPERSSEVSSGASPPMKITITNVYSVAPPPSASASRRSSNNASEEDTSQSGSREDDGVKKALFRYKVTDNQEVGKFIGKKNWSKALKLMKEDLQMGKLPKANYVSVLIQSVILRDGGRVPKQAQNDSIEFVEMLTKEYPPCNGNTADPSVRYTQSIMENVFNSESSSVSPLNSFLTKLFNLVEDDLKSGVDLFSLKLLVVVTDLVVEQYNQYKLYQKETERKKRAVIKPPLFQHFLESKEGVYHYVPCCKDIVRRLFSSEFEEMICIYLKWLNLIARSFASGYIRLRENESLVNDVAQHCQNRSDLGLFCFINMECSSFSKKVCEKIFEDYLPLNSTSTAQEEQEEIAERRLEYLKFLANSRFLEPAKKVVTDLYTEPCLRLPELSCKKTTMERWLQVSSVPDGKKKNVKGETRLHTLCNNNTIENPLEEVSRLLSSSPQDINEQDNFGNTPLHDCAANDKGDVIHHLYLLTHSQRKIRAKINLLIRNKSLETPFHLAATFCCGQTIDILKQLAKNCGVLDDVLMAPNGDGLLPFEVAEKQAIKHKLTPVGYDVDKLLHHQTISLEPASLAKLKESFALRKIVAWWSDHCV